MKEEINNLVTQIIELEHRWVPQLMNTIGNGLADVLIPLVNKFEQGNSRISLKGLYDLDRTNIQIKDEDSFLE